MRQPLFDHMSHEHGLTLLESEMHEIERNCVQPNLASHLQEAEDKAWDALSRYKFIMFGYWAAIWVHLNRIGGFKKKNPFREIVAAARNREAKP